ncbi:MAG: Na+/H+ antiporter [Solirubrobacterales bacterium]
MNEIEVLILLVAVAAVLVRLADVVSIPYPIALVVGGLGIGSLPGGPELDLDPEVIFLVFLPPLLQSAGYYASPQELRTELGPLTGLVVGLTLATMVAVAAVAQAVIPGLDWAEALVLGAIVAPTDPVAAIATFGRVGVSDRVALLVEGESMVNDATALVAYRVALGAVVAGTFSAGDAAVELLVSVAGGIALGLALAWAAVQAFRRLDDPPLAILISVLLAYVSFGVAEELGASGVLAVVSAGLYLGWHSHDTFDADLRLNAQAFWRVLVFALNAVLFILLGLQFPDILERVGETLSVGEIVGYGLLVSAVVVAVRIAWQFLPVSLERVLPSAGRISTGENWRERLLIGWSGMRGAVSLAAALSLPLTLDSGEAFASRDLIIYLTVAVILVTLVAQGLTLPPLVRLLGLSSMRVWTQDEAVARLAAAQAALDRLEGLEDERDGLPEEALERLRDLYRARFERCMAAISGSGGPIPIEDPAKVQRRLRRELIAAERGALIQLRSEGRVKADVLRTIQRELDLDEARLRV